MSSWSVRLLRISLRIHHLVCRLLWRPPTPTPMAKRASPCRGLDPCRSAPCNCSASHSQAASKMETLKFNDWTALHFAIAGPGFRALGLRRAAQVLPVVELERPLSEASQGELFNSPRPRCLGLTAVPDGFRGSLVLGAVRFYGSGLSRHQLLSRAALLCVDRQATAANRCPASVATCGTRPIPPSYALAAIR